MLGRFGCLRTWTADPGPVARAGWRMRQRVPRLSPGDFRVSGPSMSASSGVPDPMSPVVLPLITLRGGRVLVAARCGVDRDRTRVHRAG